MTGEITAAINQVASERGIDPQEVIIAIKKALIAAYLKDNEVAEEDIELLDADFTEEGEMKIYFDEKDVTPAGFGRIATQTAKQVIIYKLREKEVQTIVASYKNKIGEIVQGKVFKIDPNNVYINLGKGSAIIPKNEQIPNEFYKYGTTISVILKNVEERNGKSHIIASRSDPEYIKALFEREVPEIAENTVEIRAIAREAGKRTKLSVYTNDSSVDPIGACVGQKGIRIQSILREMDGEKIDIIPYDSMTERYIMNALSPAKVSDIKIDNEEKIATVKVPEDQQSLAIGLGGQNVRLAAKLTGWKIDIEGSEKVIENQEEEKVEMKEVKKREIAISRLGFEKRIEKSLKNADIKNVDELKELSRTDLMAIEGIGSKSAEEILKAISIL